MKKCIQIHYTLLTRCIKDIEVDEDFKIEKSTPKEIYEELCEKLQDLNISSIEEDEVVDFDTQDFGQIDAIIVQNDRQILEEHYVK